MIIARIESRSTHIVKRLLQGNSIIDALTCKKNFIMVGVPRIVFKVKLLHILVGSLKEQFTQNTKRDIFPLTPSAIYPFQYFLRDCEVSVGTISRWKTLAVFPPLKTLDYVGYPCHCIWKVLFLFRFCFCFLSFCTFLMVWVPLKQTCPTQLCWNARRQGRKRKTVWKLIECMMGKWENIFFFIIIFGELILYTRKRHYISWGNCMFCMWNVTLQSNL